MTVTTSSDAAVGQEVSGPAGQLSRWGMRARLRDVVIAELAAVALVAAVPWLGWWVAALIAVVVLVAATLTYHGATPAGWVDRAARFWWHRRIGQARVRRARIPEPFSVELPGIGAVGMRWDGQYVVTMIALHGRAYAPTVLTPAGAETIDTVPLEVVASLLRQFGGLELDSVDVVSVGRRTAGGGRYTPRYDEIVGDRPAVGLRQSWLVLRMCPQVCLSAMAYRGDAAAAAAAATERIRQALLRSGCRAVVCSAEQMTAATQALLAGDELAEMSESWSRVDGGREFVTTYRVAGADLTTRLLNDVWAVRSVATVTTVRVTAGSAGLPTVAALVRFHTSEQLTHPPLLALKALPGQAFSALLASLPLGNRAVELALSPRALNVESPLQVPVGPSGFLLGMTVTGVPLLGQFTDALRFTRVGIHADDEVVVQFVLRATAAGATVLVHTERPHVWEPVCGDRIMLAGGKETHIPTIVVYDGEDTQSPVISGGERGHAAVAVGATPPANADVVITQTSREHIRFSTSDLTNVKLTIMRPRNEAQFLAHLRRPAAVDAATANPGGVAVTSSGRR